MVVNRVLHNIYLLEVLTKAFFKYGLTNEEYFILNAYCMHDGYYNAINWNSFVKMTNKNESELKEMLQSLHARQKIIFDGERIDHEHLFDSLQNLVEADKSKRA